MLTCRISLCLVPSSGGATRRSGGRSSLHALSFLSFKVEGKEVSLHHAMW